MSLREESYARITEILRHPAVEKEVGMVGLPIVYMGENIHYLRCGRGLVVYIVEDGLANMHGALTPGDGHEVGKVWPQHLEYLRALGVTKITTRHRADHRLASRMVRALGFDLAAADNEFKRYERSI